MTVMLTMCALVLTGLVTPEEAVKGFASTTILMLIGVVIVGSALFETGVCDRVAFSGDAVCENGTADDYGNSDSFKHHVGRTQQFGNCGGVLYRLVSGNYGYPQIFHDQS